TATSAAAAFTRESWKPCTALPSFAGVTKMRKPNPRVARAPSPAKDDSGSRYDSELRQHDSISHLSHNFALDRRNFFKVFGGGLLVCVAARHANSQESGTSAHHNHE